MSGIYIPGMEMPTGDNNITLFLYPDRKVVVCGMLGPLGHYEAVPVPDHARLVDVDEFIKANEKAYDLFKNGDEISTDEATISYSYANYLINTAPTIIPADKENK